MGDKAFEAAGMRAATIAALAGLLSGCATATFTQAAGQFGVVTKAATDAQSARLATVSADENERIHTRLAQDRVELRLSPDCAARLALDQAGLTGDAAAKPLCTLTGKGGAVLETTPKFANIDALGGALNDYAGNLILLAADSSADEAAFAASFARLGTSIGALDGAIRKATKAGGETPSAQLAASASLIGQVGTLYLRARRYQALKRIILAADPVVQRATRILGQADDALGLYDQSGLGAHLEEASVAATLAASSGAPEADVRAAQDAAFAALDQYNAATEERAQFKAMGEAHAKLAAAARRGASAADLVVAINGILDLASTVSATAAAFKKPVAGGRQ